MGELRRLAVLAALVCAAHAAPAAAATKVVKLGNTNKITPAAVSISPGDTVTWDWVGPDTDHSPEALYGQAEYWDADPGEDGEYDHKLGPNFSHQFTYSGTFRYRCTVHPDQMKGTITVRGPSATLAISTPAPVTGRAVTFDAHGTTDSAGKILGYRWDLDGDPSTGPDGFEVDTGAAPVATATYQSTGPRTVRVQATDTKGYRGVAIQRIGVDSPVPVPGFMVSPYAPQRGETVTFDGSSTTDADGDITSFEWDLDGDPATGPDGFEVNTGTSPTVATLYTRGGAVDVRLRVTDAAAHSAVASRRIVLPNTAPTATFTAGPSIVGAPVTFDASSSLDPDGAIARYVWDLDGDGRFETDTGPTPRAVHTYSAPGSVTVRLRVVDDGGAAAEATRAITVAARSRSLQLTASVRPGQRLLRTRRLLVTTTCARACSVAALGTVRIAGVRRSLSLVRAQRALRGGQRATLSLLLPRSAVATLRRAARQGRRATAIVTLSAPGLGRRRVRITLRY